MRTRYHRKQILTWSGLGLTALLVFLSLIINHPVAADSGGFPTPVPPTATMIVFPTLTPTFIPLPTQSSAQQGETELKGLEESAPVTESSKSVSPMTVSSDQTSTDSTQSEEEPSSFARLLRMFLIAFMITALVFAIILGIIWIMRRFGVLS